MKAVCYAIITLLLIWCASIFAGICKPPHPPRSGYICRVRANIYLKFIRANECYISPEIPIIFHFADNIVYLPIIFNTLSCFQLSSLYTKFDSKNILPFGNKIKLMWNSSTLPMLWEMFNEQTVSILALHSLQPCLRFCCSRRGRRGRWMEGTVKFSDKIEKFCDHKEPKFRTSNILLA